MPKLNARIRNFHVFNFRCLSNWQKNVNGENFPIYGTELVQKIALIEVRRSNYNSILLTCTELIQKIALIEIVTQQTVHLALALVSRDV